MFARARHRLRIAVLVIGCLLFQQVAVAAYSCSRDQSPQPIATTSSSHCAEMDMLPPADEAPALCQKHCAPDQTLPTDTALQSVPALAPASAFILVLNEPSVNSAQRAEVLFSGSDPPPRLRYCSLQI